MAKGYILPGGAATATIIEREYKKAEIYSNVKALAKILDGGNYSGDGKYLSANGKKLIINGKRLKVGD